MQQTEQIAGHTFTLNRDAICECGVAWAWLKEYGTRDRVNDSGFAHTGILTNNEVNQIEARRERENAEDERIFAAISGVAKL